MKLLFATIGVYLAIFLVLDGIFLPAYKNGISLRPFTEQLRMDFPIDKQPIYVMNNLHEYSNMYGLNFYLDNNFENFEKEMPVEGFFLTGINSFHNVFLRYGNQYQFELLRETDNKTRDGERIIQFYRFKKIK